MLTKAVRYGIGHYHLHTTAKVTSMYEKIPDELKEQRCWVNTWNSSKIPMRSTELKAASTSCPETWSTFAEAAEAVERKMYDGIGYVFHDNGIVGIDIDDGFEDGFMNRLATDIVTHCRSYTEKSRSGRGVHILVRGKLPFKGKNNRKAVEIYKAGRYFIVTGQTLIFSEIIENQEAIDYVVRQYFPEAVKEPAASATADQRIYSPAYVRPENGKIVIKPDYPVITTGSRNLSLTSLAGQLHTQGYRRADIYRELLRANTQACKPPLPSSEVETIVNSVTRYKR